MGQGLLSRFAVAVALLGTPLATPPLPASAAPHFATEYGLGPDKWATAWLLARHAHADARVTVVALDEALPERAIPFDYPGAILRRSDDRAAFQVAVEHFGLDDPVIHRLAAIVYSIEVAFWEGKASAQAQAVEHGFRRLQQAHGRDRVPPQCYLRFFDSVAAALRRYPQGSGIPLSALLKDCAASAPRPSKGKEPAPVREVRLAELLQALRDGRDVVFVDVREPGEYREAHIPGAINLPIRQVDREAASAFARADYVVSYCVKDFRGFEMAKLLHRAGVRNSVIMKPYGIKGWVASGLPVAGSEALSEHVARQRLMQCLHDGQCTEDG